MILIDKVMNSIDNYFFSSQEEEEVMEVNELQEKAEVQNTKKTVTKTVKVANGPDIEYTESITEPKFSSKKVNIDQPASPKLQVMTQKSFKIRTFNISSFNNVKEAADALKAGKCIILNFENIAFNEQYRICDFLNGACYVLNGSVKRINQTMVIYAPEGISIEGTK